MSHVTDGQLHAYLDGALDRVDQDDSTGVREHLEACDLCAQRLSEEREIRQRSQEILDASGPDAVEIPPFEEIRRRATAVSDRPPKPGRGGPPRGWGLAWAASVILALGLGWVGRDLGWRGADFSATEPNASVAPSRPAEFEAAQDGVVRQEGVVGGFDDAERRNRAEVVVDEAVGTDPTDVSDLQSSVRTPTEVPETSFDQAKVTTETGNEVGRSVSNAPVGSREQQDRRLVEEADPGRADVTPAAPVVAPAAESVTTAERLARRGAGEQVQGQASAELRERAAQVAPEMEAEEAPGSLMLDEVVVTGAVSNSIAVPGLEILSVALDGDEFVVRQQLPDGGVLELHYLESEPSMGVDRKADEDAEAFAERDRLESALTSRAVRAVGDKWLVATAPIPLEELQEWLDRIR